MTAESVPHNIDAERMVLGCLLDFFPASAAVVLPKLDAPDFYRPEHGMVYDAIRKLAVAGKPVELPSVKTALVDAGEYERIGGRDYLIELADSCGGTAANAGYYADQVLEASKRRKLMLAGMELKTRAADAAVSVSDVLAAHQRAIFDTQEHRQQSGGRIGKIVDGVVRELDRVQREGTPPGVRLGIPALDGALGGIRGGNVMVLAGLRGTGKSALAGAVSLHLAKRDVPTLYVSLEMEPTELGSRLLASISETPHSVIRAAKASGGQWEKIMLAQAELEKLPLLVRAPAPTIEAVTSEIAMAGFELGRPPAVVVIDYLQLLSDSKAGSEYEAVTRASRAIKALARQTKTAILLLSQLNRASEQEGRRPELRDLRQSGQVENDADAVLLLWRNPADQPDSWGTVSTLAKLAKNRHGPALDFWPDQDPAGAGITLRWRPSIMRFSLSDGQPAATESAAA